MGYLLFLPHRHFYLRTPQHIMIAYCSFLHKFTTFSPKISLFLIMLHTKSDAHSLHLPPPQKESFPLAISGKSSSRSHHFSSNSFFIVFSSNRYFLSPFVRTIFSSLLPEHQRRRNMEGYP